MPSFKESDAIPPADDSAYLDLVQSGSNVYLNVKNSRDVALSNLLIFDAVNRKLVLRKVVNADKVPLDLDADGYPVVVRE